MARLRRSAFTLVELLVVITVIAMLMALLIPAVQAARERARNTQCQNNLKQLGTAMISYNGRKDKLPGWLSGGKTISNADWVAGWTPQILPELQRNDLYEVFTNNQLDPSYQTLIPTLVCPSDFGATEASTTPLSYGVNGGMPDASTAPPDHRENGAFFNLITNGGARIGLDWIAGKDGVSTTIMLAENTDLLSWVPAGSTDAEVEFSQAVVWYLTPSPPGTMKRSSVITPATPTITSAPGATPLSGHPSSFNVAYCDGSVTSLNQEMDFHVYFHLMTPQGRQVKYPGTTSRIPAADFPNASWIGTLNQADLDR